MMTSPITDPSQTAPGAHLPRRALVQGAAWAVPALTLASAAPAFAASGTGTGEYGLYVTAYGNMAYGTSGHVGYNGTNNTGQRFAATPSAYFAAVSSGAAPEADINWSDAGRCTTSTAAFTNGEGSFTPAGNSASAAAGSYASSSGFWWSVPTTTAYKDGAGYIKSSTATLVKGATFVTQVTIIVPPVPNDPAWPTSYLRIAGQSWTTALTGTRSTINRTTAPYLANQVVAGTWAATAPTTTTLSDGSIQITGTITYKTTVDYKVTQTNTIYYGQTEIMPATIELTVSDLYPWTSVTLTSSVQSATINYTGQPAGSPSSVTLSNQLLTTSTITPTSC